MGLRYRSHFVLCPAALCLGMVSCAGPGSGPINDGNRGGEPSERQRDRSGAPSGAPLLSDLDLPPLPTATSDTAPGPNGADARTQARSAAALAHLADAERARFVRIPAPEGAHTRVCDLAVMGGQIFLAYADEPINTDGAQVYRFDPTSERWTLAFDWDRGGSPGRTHEMGGQGITRLRPIGDRLLATDADAPLMGGFGWTSAPFEDYVFVAEGGQFAPLGPDMAPPANTIVLPLSFHVFDILLYRGALVATGGTISGARDVPPNPYRNVSEPKDSGASGDSRRPTNRYPGGLFVGAPDAQVLWPRFLLAENGRVGVVRTTYAHVFAGRLYVGLQNNGSRIRWDLAVLSGDPLAPDTPAPVLARVTERGGWLTHRFASSADTLYWIASRPRRPRRSALFASADGVRFVPITLPEGAGTPQDIVIAGQRRYLLASGGLYRAGPDHRFRRIAPAPPGDPFGRFNTFCSAPLIAAPAPASDVGTGADGTVRHHTLYAASTRDGALYRIVLAPPSSRETSSCSQPYCNRHQNRHQNRQGGPHNERYAYGAD